MTIINNDSDFQTLIYQKFNHNSGLILKDIEFGIDYELHFKNLKIPNVNNAFAQIRFENCDFKGHAFFDNSTFEYSTTFLNVNFHGISVFAYSVFKENVRFENCSFSNNTTVNGHFDSTQINGARAIFKKNKGLVEFWNIKFSESSNFILEMDYPKEYGVASFGENAYRIAKQQAYKTGNIPLGDNYNYLERSYRGFQIIRPLSFWDGHRKGLKKIDIFRSLKEDKHYKYLPAKLADLISKYLIGYGEKPGRCLVWMVFFLVIYAIIFMYAGLKINNEVVHLSFNSNCTIGDSIKSIFDFFFFSVVTFTTVGYGDITTCNFIGKVIASSEMILGVTLTGAWTATLLKKLMK